MGFEQTIQGLPQLAWPVTAVSDSAKPRSAAGRPGAFNPAGAETPEEALTYIEFLYKAGHTDELAGLLRRSSVFREAWQNLQQLPAFRSEAVAGPASSLPDAASTPELAGLPAPTSGAVPRGQLHRPSQVPVAQTFPVLVPKPARPLAFARQVYEAQARYYAQERADSPRISLMV